MLKIKSTIILLLISYGLLASSPIKLGVDVLKEHNFDILKGKRVGLITNPTGVDRNLKSTIDILNEANEVKLVALFAPEHGVRGDVYAGDKVETYTDLKTGIPVYSLYGKSVRPTKEMLEKIDVIVYDIQDIGTRSYTFISTLGAIMEEAAKYGKEVVVLDRPNPLGGERVEGCITEDGFISFVSAFKIPYVYGLTVGELATMLNEEGMIKGKCKLTVVAMKGWKRDMRYQETGLQWIAPSPHIPNAATADFYPATGILGELGIVSIGVGYTMPFQLVASDSISANQLSDSLNALNMEGAFFRPIYIKPFYATGKGLSYQGVQIHLTNPEKIRLSEIQFYIMQEIFKQNPKLDFFKRCDKSRIAMWNKVCGTDYIYKEFSKSYRFDTIKDYWRKDEKAFKSRSKQYLLYH
jgi:uncharacterized protein YbbC (DUF1343 family)